MTDQHDARDETAELLAWFTEADGFNQGTKAPHKWVLRAEQELRRLAATQPTKPEQQAGGVPAGLEAFDQAVADEALMRQALETIENGQQVRNFEGGTKFQPPLENAAITALRKRLESSK